MEELFDIYTREGKYLGVKTKKECHQENPGFYHKPVWIWIVNHKGEILVQKRASTKKVFPNCWDMPSAGHVRAGETSIDGAIRETFEELGITTKKEDYTYMGEYIADSYWEIGQIYLLKLDIETKDIIIQKEEVSEVKWLPYNEFIKLLYSDKFCPHDKAYKEIVERIVKK